MTRARRPRVPDVVRDETATLAPGDPGYWLLLTDDEVEGLASGRVPTRDQHQSVRNARMETRSGATDRARTHGGLS